MSKRWWRPARLVFLTVHEDADFARAALDAGRLGYVVKARLASDLLGSFPANGTGLAVGGGWTFWRQIPWRVEICHGGTAVPTNSFNEPKRPALYDCSPALSSARGFSTRRWLARIVHHLHVKEALWN